MANATPLLLLLICTRLTVGASMYNETDGTIPLEGRDGMLQQWPFARQGMDILGSTFRHGLDWVTTLTHSIRRVVLFDPQHPGHETQVLKIMNPDVSGSMSGKASISTQNYTMAYTVTQEPITTWTDDESISVTSDTLTESFEPVAAFVKNDTLIIEPVYPSEENRVHPDVFPEIPDLPTVKRERPQENRGVFHIAVGAIGLSTIVTGVVLMSSFKERTYRPSILVSRGVQTI